MRVFERLIWVLQTFTYSLILNGPDSDRAAELVERLREERKAQLRLLIAKCEADLLQVLLSLNLTYQS